MRIRFALLAFLALAFIACDESTGTLGISAEIDNVSNTTSSYPVQTQSILMDKGIIANNSNCFLGRVVDPETGSMVEADFAAQFQTFEDYEFPDKEQMVDRTDTLNIKYGVPVCDSCEVRLYFDSYYGDKTNPMKVEVYEMSSKPEQLLNEDSIYYTDVDLQQFLPENAKPLTSRMFTVSDYETMVEGTSASTRNIQISLPKSFGQHIMDKFYEDKKNFQDSYHFTHNVMPGLYFRCSSGDGTMVKVYVGTMNLFFNFKETKKDSIYTGMARFAATPEVIQSTRFQNSANIKNLVSCKDYTYLKTPAGIATEVTLPIDEIFGGEHAIDSVSKASITFTKYNKMQEGFQFGTPSELLMVRKAEMYDFFYNRRVSNARTSYTTAFASTYNTYTFSNISRLLSFCKHEKIDAIKQRLKDKGMTNFTQKQFDEEEQKWMEENPDWNKVVLIPVVTSSASTTLGTMQVSVNHDMSLNSIKLVGGKDLLSIDVVYSRFK